MTEPLSPTAQAVMDAADIGFSTPSERIAAALRAAADQVVPVTSKPDDEFCCPPVATIVWNCVMEIRKHFLAIADELEGVND